MLIDSELNGFNAPKSKIRSFFEFIWEMVKIVVISMAIILPVRYFLIQPFYVKGASMEPNFYDHEYLVIDEISYRMAEPKRGDIVVFKYPKDPRQFFIKRVIGLPGEKVVVKEGGIYINDNRLAESYLPEKLETSLPQRGYGEVTLASNEYYLMGDNREQSLDSRVFGPVQKDYIVGRTWLRGWPFDRFTVFNTPEYK